jgi:hypothetical protein
VTDSGFATFPLPPRLLPDGRCRAQLAVTVDGIRLGVIEQDEHGDWWAKPKGWAWYVPARFGLRMEAIAFLVWALDRPSGWRPNRPAWRPPAEAPGGLPDA